jgi:hypothetical protein
MMMKGKESTMSSQPKKVNNTVDNGHNHCRHKTFDPDARKEIGHQKSRQT